jgi:hypothetical protein
MFRVRSIAAVVLVMSLVVAAQGMGADAKAERVDPATTAPTTKPTTTPAEAAEIKAVREAAKGFVKALFGDDVNATRAAFGGSKADLEMMQGVRTAVRADHAVHAAINKKFPPTGGDAKRGELMGLEELAKMFDEAEVVIEGDVAGLQEFVLKKADGKWKVIGFTEWDKPQAAVYIPGFINGSNEVLAALKKGQFETRDEALEALGNAVETHITAALESQQAAARSATQPAMNEKRQPQQP